MSLYYRHIDDIIIISGKTYPYKDIIKSHGGRFQGGEKVWTLPANEESLKEIKELCKRVGGGPVKTSTPKPSSKAVAPSPTPVTTSPEPSLAPEGLSISELMAKVQLHLQRGFPRAQWVIGEIQSLNRRPTGSYLQLADMKEGASKSATMAVNAVIWGSTQKALMQKLGPGYTDLLQEGMKIRALVQVSFYKDRGSVSLNILDLDPKFTKGALALARETVLRELRAKGLDKKNKSLEGSIFPLKIGLLSAKGSRAQSDFLDQLKVYGFPGEVLFHPTQMQGEKTIQAVCQGITTLEAEQCDYIIVTRGGGSHADLRWFDDLKIALAIAHCQVPVIAAIGHHDDVCVAEDIAYMREKTPTAAADFILARLAGATERIKKANHELYLAAKEKIHQQEGRRQDLAKNLQHLSQAYSAQMSEHLSILASHLMAQYHRGTQQFASRIEALRHSLRAGSESFLSTQQRVCIQAAFSLRDRASSPLNSSQRQLDGLRHQLRQNCDSSLGRSTSKLQDLYTAIVRRDPGPWLAQGWTQLLSAKGKISSIHQLEPNEELKARLKDGRIKLTVATIEGNSEDE